MKSGTLLLLCGLPGVGKTTLSKKLGTERQAIRLCPDDWIPTLVENQNNITERDRLRDPVEQLLWKMAQSLLTLGVTVILENGFWAKEERDRYRDIGKNLGAKVELHFLDTPFDILLQRVRRRNSDPNTFQVMEEKMQEGYKVFQPPTLEEGQIYDYFKHYHTFH